MNTEKETCCLIKKVLVNHTNIKLPQYNLDVGTVNFQDVEFQEFVSEQENYTESKFADYLVLWDIANFFDSRDVVRDLQGYASAAYKAIIGMMELITEMNAELTILWMQITFLK